MTYPAPTKKEVLEEMVRSSPFSDLKMAGVGAVNGAFAVTVIPFAVPSAYTRLKPNAAVADAVAIEHSGSEYVCGLVGGIAGAVVGIVAFKTALDSYSVLPYVLLGTNLASGVYEYGRTLYSNAQSRIEEKQRIAEKLERDSRRPRANIIEN